MDNEPDFEMDDLYGIWLSVTGGTLTGSCAFCGKHAELVTTSADDLVCQSCYQEFEDFLNTGNTE
jgi:protein-arginine kinase activator protein McsA